MENRLFGFDPEFFIVDKISSSGLLSLVPPAYLVDTYNIPYDRTKNGKRLFMSIDGVNIIEDGAAFEINTIKPFSSQFSLDRYILKFKNYLSTLIKDFYYDFSTDVTTYFDVNKYCTGKGNDFLDCIRMGCDKDFFPKYLYNVGLENEEECIEFDSSKYEYRFSGGHLHLQNMTDNPSIYINQVQHFPFVFDFIIGTTNVLLDRPDRIKNQELKRLEKYGHPSRYRIQKYSDTVNGVEYRPLSSFWVFSMIGNQYKILASANVAASIVEANKSRKFFDTFIQDIPAMWECLTTFDIPLAEKLFKKSILWALDEGFITISSALEVLNNVCQQSM